MTTGRLPQLQQALGRDLKMSEDIVDSFTFARELQLETRERLRADVTRKIVPPGTDILHPGDTVNGVYLVRSGAIRVYYIGLDGREGTLYWIRPGESCILALNSLFTEIPYPAWASADEGGAEILSISGAAFREAFAREPAVQRFLFEQLSERVFLAPAASRRGNAAAAGGTAHAAALGAGG